MARGAFFTLADFLRRGKQPQHSPFTARGFARLAAGHPNELEIPTQRRAPRILRRGNDYVSDVAKKFTRLPFGHPEAFIEAFANIYLEVIAAVRDQWSQDWWNLRFSHGGRWRPRHGFLETCGEVGEVRREVDTVCPY